MGGSMAQHFFKDTLVLALGVFEHHEGQEITIEDDSHHR